MNCFNKIDVVSIIDFKLFLFLTNIHFLSVVVVVVVKVGKVKGILFWLNVKSIDI